MIRSQIVLAVLVLSVAACGGDTTPPGTDSGPSGSDGGPTSGSDGGPTGGGDGGPTGGGDGGPTGGSDSGPTGGSDSGPTGDDSGPRTDGGGMTGDAGGSDPCSATMSSPESTVGCNGGFVTGEPAANEPDGMCTPDSEGGRGTCTLENSECYPEPFNFCATTCPRVETYVSAGGCPTGYRCFHNGLGANCFRDCDDAHPCPTGFSCREGGCEYRSGD
jgi:hypothetical protein